MPVLPIDKRFVLFCIIVVSSLSTVYCFSGPLIGIRQRILTTTATLLNTRHHTVTTRLLATETEAVATTTTPLCDLQTFLKLSSLVETGGKAKIVIQSGRVTLNSDIEKRRAKKLFVGDQVSYEGRTLDVQNEVSKKGYVYKIKKKKVKPTAKIDGAGNLEFGGRFRSEAWRAERKEKKNKKKFIYNKN